MDAAGAGDLVPLAQEPYAAGSPVMVEETGGAVKRNLIEAGFADVGFQAGHAQQATNSGRSTQASTVSLAVGSDSSAARPDAPTGRTPSRSVLSGGRQPQRSHEPQVNGRARSTGRAGNLGRASGAYPSTVPGANGGASQGQQRPEVNRASPRPMQSSSSRSNLSYTGGSGPNGAAAAPRRTASVAGLAAVGDGGEQRQRSTGRLSGSPRNPPPWASAQAPAQAAWSGEPGGLSARRRGASPGAAACRSGSPPATDLRGAAARQQREAFHSEDGRQGLSRGHTPGHRGGRRSSDWSASPEPPRMHVPPQPHPVPAQHQAEDPMIAFAAAEADPLGGMLSALMSIPGVDAQQRPMLVDALTRIASAFGGGSAAGHPGDAPAAGPGAAAAAAAVAAVAATAAMAANVEGELGGPGGPEARRGHCGVTRPLMMLPQLLQLPQSFTELEARMGRIESDMIDAQGGGPLVQRGASVSGGAGAVRELELLRARAGRLEHEVAELRTQTARRLDAAARETALSRREAEEAHAEVASLRTEVERLSVFAKQAHSEDGGEKREAEGVATTLPGGVVAPQSTVPLRGDRVPARPASAGLQASGIGTPNGALLAPRLPQRGLSSPAGPPVQHGPC